MSDRPNSGLRLGRIIDKRTPGRMLAVMDRNDLKRLLGPFPERCPLDAVRLETADCGPYVRETIEYAVETDERVKSFLLVPKHINRSVPAIFAHHQHASQFHLGKSEVVGLKGDADQAYASENRRARLCRHRARCFGVRRAELEQSFRLRRILRTGHASCTRQNVTLQMPPSARVRFHAVRAHPERGR